MPHSGAPFKLVKEIDEISTLLWKICMCMEHQLSFLHNKEDDCEIQYIVSYTFNEKKVYN